MRWTAPKAVASACSETEAADVLEVGADLFGGVCLGHGDEEYDADGQVARTWVIKSSGNRELDRAAVKNLKGCRFDAKAIARSGYGRRSFRNDVRFEID